MQYFSPVQVHQLEFLIIYVSQNTADRVTGFSYLFTGIVVCRDQTSRMKKKLKHKFDLNIWLGFQSLIFFGVYSSPPKLK